MKDTKRLKWTIFFILMILIPGGGSVALFSLTLSHLRPAPQSLHTVLSDSQYVQILDRRGEPLNTTYQNRWNIHDVILLYQIPDFLKNAFIISEDKRFYHHKGPDWLARWSALLTNIKSGHIVRGASTITEQTVRMLHPRPRSFWSRWLEGFEASTLEQGFTKDEILEFYLNQIPYAAHRRGLIQAARYYFNRDLTTLNRKEMLALVVLVRAPSRLDLWKNTKTLETRITRLASQLVQHGLLPEKDRNRILAEGFDLKAPHLSVNAREFVQHVKHHPLLSFAGWPHVKTTLDGVLQQRIQTMLDARLRFLKPQRVHNGAVLVVDHTNGDILAWVVAGKGTEDSPGRFIDAVITPRQPGSALKPFLYARALEKGWSAATVIEDAPLMELVGHGLHNYQNYSRSFYGPVTLREALGNSLNIPALKTLQYLGAEEYLNTLKTFGFQGLTHHPNFYGDGLALGNGEVTLYELVQAYAALANRGVFQPLTPFSHGLNQQSPHRVLSPETSSLIGHILSDPKARDLEFGHDSILNFPVQTAVKTGTSSDYRDSWAVGFNTRYTVGVWMGNLDQQPTDGITGSVGPALLLRSIFSELTQNQETRPLPLHRKLIRHDVCVSTHQIKKDGQTCKAYTEWFIPGTEPRENTKNIARKSLPVRLRQPTQGLHMAYDPRLPRESQAFEFYIQGLPPDAKVIWSVDTQKIITKGGRYMWPLQKGEHEVEATVWQGKKKIADIEKVKFLVK